MNIWHIFVKINVLYTIFEYLKTFKLMNWKICLYTACQMLSVAMKIGKIVKCFQKANQLVWLPQFISFIYNLLKWRYIYKNVNQSLLNNKLEKI
jgi:hypothetical protein